MERPGSPEILNGLISALKDSERGLQQAFGACTVPGVKAVCADLATERAAFANQLQGLVAGLGEEYATESTLAGALHRGWVQLKTSLSAADDHAVMVECEREGEALLAEYREALQQHDLSESVASVLRAQAMTLQAAHDRVRVVRDSLAVSS